MMRTPAAPALPAAPAETKSSAANGIVLAISAVFGFFAVRLLPPMLAARIAGGVVAGLVVGLIPFFVARSRGDAKFGANALGWCAIAGGVLGILLAAPVAVGFTIAATRRSPAK